MIRISWLLILAVLLPLKSYGFDAKNALAESQKICNETLQTPKRFNWKVVDFEQVFKKLVEAEIPLTTTSIKKNGDEVGAIFVALYGRAVTGDDFILAVRRYVGNWDVALEKFNLSDAKYKLDNDAICRRIRLGLVDIKPFFDKILAQGLLLNSESIGVNNERASMAVAKEIWGVDIKGPNFVKSVRKFYGSWDKGLEAFGYDPADHRLTPNDDQRMQWASIDFGFTFKKIVEAGIPLVSHALKNEYSDELSAVFVKNYGKAVTGEAFVVAVQKYFGKWNDALEKLNFSDPIYKIDRVVTNRRQIRWADIDFAPVFAKLVEAEIPLSEHSLVEHHSDELSSIFLGLYHRPVNAAAFNMAVIRRYAGWDAALQKLGFADVHYRVEKNAICKRIRRGLVDLRPFFKELLKKGLYLNVGAILVTNERASMAVAKEIWGVEMTGSGFLSAVRKYYGSWDQALIAYGYDPTVHRLRLSPKQRGKFSRGSVLAISPHQGEWVKQADGSSLYQASLGEAALSPEEELEQKESEDNLEKAVGKLAGDHRELTRALIDYLNEHSDLDDHDEVANDLTAQLHRNVAWPEVQFVLSQLSQNLAAYR